MPQAFISYTGSLIPPALCSFGAQESTVFFFNYTATTDIYTLSLHDALPISSARSIDYRSSASSISYRARNPSLHAHLALYRFRRTDAHPSSSASDGDDSRRSASTSRRYRRDRKSTRLNSSHVEISYAVFCLK